MNEYGSVHCKGFVLQWQTFKALSLTIKLTLEEITSSTWNGKPFYWVLFEILNTSNSFLSSAAFTFAYFFT